MWYVQLHSQLEIQYGGLQADFDNLKAQLDEETDGAATLRTQLQKSQADYQTLKSKYDKDVSARADELDELRSASLSVNDRGQTDRVTSHTRWTRRCCCWPRPPRHAARLRADDVTVICTISADI